MGTEEKRYLVLRLRGERPAGWIWPLGPLGLAVGTEGSASAGRRVSPEGTGQGRPGQAGLPQKWSWH